MKLLIVTQTVDLQDPVLGFFHRWVEEFAKHCEQVIVVCLKEGAHRLPENVTVHSLGKLNVAPHTHTSFACALRRLRYLASFFRYIWTFRYRYDAVFVHMNPEYVVPGAPFWRLWGKRVVLWYTHKSVTVWLRIAVHLAHTIFTASKESFRIPSSKVHAVGHGIDTDLFHPSLTSMHLPHTRTQDALRLVSVGRISRTKRQDLAVLALEHIRAQGTNATLTLIGTSLTDADRAYEAELRILIADRTLDAYVVWAGAVPNADLPARLGQMDMLVHTSETGSLDKVVLEALASGVLLVTTSEPVRAVLPAEVGEAAYSVPTPEAIASRITALAARVDIPTLRTLGRTYVESHHALPALVRRILDTIA